MSALNTASTTGLSTSDIEGIREGLAAGRKPKVMFTESAGQIAGEIGQVVKLNDPAESDDWVVVRFGRDELPFPPTDLTMPPRGRTTKSTAASTSGAASSATAAPNNPPVPSQPAAASSSAPSASATPTAGQPTAGSGAAPANATAPAARAAKDTAKKARPGKAKQPPGLTVTLAYENGEWTVAAQQGSKTLAKPFLVKASEALKLVAFLDMPGVQQAVEAIVESERAEAAARAEQLRNELAEVEARLAELG